MGFVLSKVLWPFLAPSNWLAVLLLSSAAAAWLGRWRATRRLLTVALLLFLPLAVLPAGAWLNRPLENRFPVPVLPEEVDGIVVLGGSLRTHMTRARGAPQVNEYSERLFALMSLARRYPRARLLFTGGEAAISPEGTTEAEVARDLLAATGFETARVVFEDRSRNTYENAVYGKRLADPKPGETWLLVTSAAHMPRAVGCFRRVGFAVLPLPVDYQTTPAWTDPFSFGFAANLAGLDGAFREWVGLVAYRLMDRTDALFPAP